MVPMPQGVTALKVMPRISVSIPTGRLVDSLPINCSESLRHRCAGPTPGKLPLAREVIVTRSLPVFRPKPHTCPSAGPFLCPPCSCLSQSVRAERPGDAAHPARSTTIPAYHLWMMHRKRPHRPRTTAGEAQGQTAQSSGHHPHQSAPQGPQNRPLLPQHHPYPRSRSYEEGNVDQRIATGGMPHRDR